LLVEPASLEQVMRANDGRYVLIDADVSTVAADLQKIDARLKVRFAESGRPPFFVVFLEERDAEGRTSQHLVLTQKAHLTASGTWAGLDQRIVKRIEEIDAHGRGGYDYAKALERETLAREKRASGEFAERVGDGMERMAFGIRRELGLGSLRGGIFVPRDIESG
jgi:hypothetical protein